MANELWRNSASQLAGMIARRETTSRAVVEAHLARIAEVNPALNAIPLVLEADALAAAAAADRAVASGAPLGPLHGVPITVKNNLDLIGSPTTNGVPAFAQAMPTLDAPVVERMKAAGAIPIARTNLPDMALRLHTDSSLHGLTRNPWNLAYTVGGSSGGEAAALATGMSPLGLGNDIGGSLRNPAFCCGIASLKPGFGRVPSAASIEPRSGVLVGQLMAVDGPMARTVADLRLALGVLAGPHPRDPFSFPGPLQGPARGAPVKVAMVPDPPGGTTAPEISEAVRTAGAALKQAGYDVVEVAPPLVELAIETWGKWLVWELGTQAEILAQVMGADAVRFFRAFTEIFGAPASYAESVMLMAQRHVIARAWSEFFADYPVILGPTWCQPQFQHGYDIAGPGSARDMLNLMRFVTPANVLGLPAACVAAGKAASGLPLGVQLIADRFREDMCLDAAEAIEQRLGTITPIDPVR